MSYTKHETYNQLGQFLISARTDGK